MALTKYCINRERTGCIITKVQYDRGNHGINKVLYKYREDRVQYDKGAV